MSLARHQGLAQGCGTRRFATLIAAEKAVERGAQGQPAQCRLGAHWHLESAPAPSRKAPRHTGPGAGMRAMVLQRDSLGDPPWPCCVSCGTPVRPGGYSIHHRLDRSIGGRNEFPNLLTLCGSGTAGCHGRVTDLLDPHDIGKGYVLGSSQDPAREPVMVFTGPGCGILMLLTEDGDRVPVGGGA